MEREKLKGNLDLLLLSVLAAGPAHGYAVIRRCASAARVPLTWVRGLLDLAMLGSYPRARRFLQRRSGRG